MGTTSLMMYGTTCGWPDFILKHMKVSKYENSACSYPSAVPVIRLVFLSL